MQCYGVLFKALFEFLDLAIPVHGSECTSRRACSSGQLGQGHLGHGFGSDVLHDHFCKIVCIPPSLIYPHGILVHGYCDFLGTGLGLELTSLVQG